MRPDRKVTGDQSRDLLAAAFAIIFSVACVLQFNQYPLERFPNWDAFWVDTQTVAFLGALRDALHQGTIPIISPYTDFGWYAAGDTTLIASAFNPIHWLVLVFDPVTVIVIRTITYFSIAAFGVYLYFARVLEEPVAGIVAGAAYLSLPMNYSLLYHSNMLGFVYFVPVLLLLIHRVIDGRSRFAWLWFALWAALSTASSDVYGIIALPVVIGAYSFFLLLPALKRRSYRLFLVPTSLVLLWLAVSSFYVVPFAYNVIENGSFARAAAIPPNPPLTVGQFLDFLNKYVLWNAFFKPVDTVSVILYVPVFLYFILGVSFTLGWRIFTHSGKQRLLVALALLGAAIFLFIESFVFYSIPALATSSTGLLRVQIKLYPYLITIAAFICLAEWVRLAYTPNRDGSQQPDPFRKRIMMAILTIVGIVSALFDIYTFADLHRPVSPDPFEILHRVTKPFLSSSLVPLNVTDAWPLLIPTNLLIFVCAAAAIFLQKKNQPEQLGWKSPQRIASTAVLGVAIACLAEVSVNNEARLQQGRWAYETNSDYRIRTFRERAACVDKLTGPRDAFQFRTLYAGREIYKGHNGRNWKAIAETELNVPRHEKVMFPYRNTTHPFVAVVRNAFGDSSRTQNLWPVEAAMIPSHLDLARFLGARWIISNDEPLDLTETNGSALIALGSCITDQPTSYTDEPFQGGETFAYEIPAAHGVAFVAPRDSSIDYPALEGPSAGVALMRQLADGQNTAAPSATVTAEGYGRFVVDAEAPSGGGHLIVSMLDRPNWRARVDETLQPIEVAFGGFMSVEIPSGHSRVEFTYRPYEIWAGAGISFATLLLTFVGSAGQQRWRRTEKTDHVAG